MRARNGGYEAAKKFRPKDGGFEEAAGKVRLEI